jgi:hypothetical protein
MMTTGPRYVVGIVVDPAIGDQLSEILGRMPVWIAATETNRRTAERAWSEQSTVQFTEPGGLTIFNVDPNGTREDWLADVIGEVAGHYDRYSRAPGYSAIEVVGVNPTPRLRELLASYRLTLVSLRPNGFLAATDDGSPGGSPNDD